MNQYTPDGAVTYQPTGQYDWTDPSTGSTYQIPTFSAFQQLSPQQEAIKKATTAISIPLKAHEMQRPRLIYKAGAFRLAGGARLRLHQLRSALVPGYSQLAPVV